MIVKKVMRESKFCKLAFVWTRVGFVAPPFCFARVDSGSSKSRVDAETTPCLTRTTMGRLRPQEKKWCGGEAKWDVLLCVRVRAKMYNNRK